MDSLIAVDLANLDWSLQDVFRVTVVLFCFMLVGTNTAFITHIPVIFPHGGVKIWRLFFLGKSLITLSVAFMVWDRTQQGKPLSWYTVMAAVGMLISNLALFFLWKLKRGQKDLTLTIKGNGHA